MAYLEGDGCMSTGDMLIAITTSQDLAWQLRIMLNSLKIKNSIRISAAPGTLIHKKYGSYDTKQSYRIELYGGSVKKIRCRKFKIYI